MLNQDVCVYANIILSIAFMFCIPSESSREPPYSNYPSFTSIKGPSPFTGLRERFLLAKAAVAEKKNKVAG